MSISAIYCLWFLSLKLNTLRVFLAKNYTFSFVDLLCLAAVEIDKHGLKNVFLPFSCPSHGTLNFLSFPTSFPFLCQAIFQCTSKIPHLLVSDKISFPLIWGVTFILRWVQTYFLDMFSVQFLSSNFLIIHLPVLGRWELFLGESAVPCHQPLSPPVPYELVPLALVLAVHVWVRSGWTVRLDHSAFLGCSW